MSIRFFLMAAGLGQLGLAMGSLAIRGRAPRPGCPVRLGHGPVDRGYGLPLSYFALHGLLRLTEQRLERAGHPISRHAWVGRAWTIFWLVLPLPILFHRPFLAGVIWPLLGAAAAGSTR
jgi:hypothetical protein